jgi:hypothetical protein
MRTPNALRQKRYRDRRRKGLFPVQIAVSQSDVEFLKARAYEINRFDKESIGHAVEGVPFGRGAGGGMTRRARSGRTRAAASRSGASSGGVGAEREGGHERCRSEFAPRDQHF